MPPSPQARGLKLMRPQMAPVSVPLDDEQAVVGRADAADLVFEESCVSRMHGAFRREGGRLLFQDLDSRNGTRLLPRDGGDPIALTPHQTVPVSVGDVLELGGGASRVEILGKAPAPEDATDPTLRSDAAKAFADRLKVAALTRAPVFLLGRSGSGKTHAARRIHDLGRSDGMFVPINCARLPRDSTALHSELLGHKRGAFTGADSDRQGKLDQASGGTLFLDEVESLPAPAQGFLLDVLEGTGDLAPLGAAQVMLKRPVFRLVSASKLPLARSGLRRDLSERLAEGYMWVVPRLEDRQADIPGLLQGFADEQTRMLGVEVLVTDEAVAFAKDAPWPGQIRQLKATLVALAQRAVARAIADTGGTPPERVNVRRKDLEQHLAERALAFDGLAAGALGFDDSGFDDSDETRQPPPPGQVAPPPRKVNARKLTREQVLGALQAAGGNQSAAARALGVARNTLLAKMKRFGID
jgi:DNA-binding NtrC family response regulator